MSNLRAKTLKGIGWATSSQVIKIVLGMVVASILAHLLEPSDFGLVAMVIVFTNLLNLLNDMGLQAALIQKKDISEDHISSAFWVNLAEGFLLTLVFAALAPLIAHFYNESRLTLIVLVVSPIFTISSLGMIQGAIFQKRLDFKTLAIIDISATVLAGAAAVSLAYSGAGVWSLVLQAIIAVIVYTIIIFFWSRWKPSFLCKWTATRELMGFGLPLMGNGFVNYFSRNLDNMLIGKFLGPESLGFYALAYKLLLFPLYNISSMISRVMFPALSLIQNDKAKVRDAYIKATRYIAVVTFPMMAGLAITAPEFVRVVFGSQWTRSIFLIQVLAGVSLIQSIGTTIGWIYLSQGRTNVMLKWSIFSVVIATTAFIIGLHWDVEGVAVAYAIASLLLAYPLFAIPFRFIDLKFLSFIKNFATIGASTACMGVITCGTRLLLVKTLGASDVITLLATVSVGIVSYAGTLFLIDRGTYRDLLVLLKELKAPRAATDKITEE